MPEALPTPSGAASSRVRERVLAVSLSVASVLLVAGAAEALARLLRPSAAPEVFGPFITDWAAWDGDFYTVKSAAVGWPPWEDYNSEGLRDREHALRKPEGVKRVVCLGDSVTLGYGVPVEDAYPRFLQDRLDEAGASTEVLNVALGGWATRQERIAYRRIARRYSPDLVLLGLCLNDVPEMLNNLERPPRWLAALHRRSAFVRLVVDAQGREIRAIDDLFRRPDAEPVRRGWAHVFEELRALRDDVQGDGARLVVLTFPYKPQLDPGFPGPRPQEEVARFCRELGVACLDLLPALREGGDEAFLDHVHLTAAGSRRVAEEVAASGLLSLEPGAPENPSLAVSTPSAAAPPAAPALVVALRSPSAEERARAAWALGRLGAQASSAVEALVGALSDPDPRVRAGAAWALGRAGMDMPAVSSALVARLDDADDKVVWRAGAALGMLGLGPAQVQPLLEVVSRPESRGRAVALESLGRIGPAAEPAVPVMVAALADARSAVRAKAAWALGAVGREPRQAVPALVGVLGDPACAGDAALALGAFGSAAAPAVRPLVEALASPNPSLRWRAARTLGQIGEAAREGIPALLAAAGDSQTNVRLAALHSLSQVHAAPDDVLPLFERGLADPDPRLRSQAARSLGQLGPAARPSLERLHQVEDDPDPAVAAAVRKAIARIEARAPRAANVPGDAAVPVRP